MGGALQNEPSATRRRRRRLRQDKGQLNRRWGREPDTGVKGAQGSKSSSSERSSSLVVVRRVRSIKPSSPRDCLSCWKPCSFRSHQSSSSSSVVITSSSSSSNQSHAPHTFVALLRSERLPPSVAPSSFITFLHSRRRPIDRRRRRTRPTNPTSIRRHAATSLLSRTHSHYRLRLLDVVVLQRLTPPHASLAPSSSSLP